METIVPQADCGLQKYLNVHDHAELRNRNLHKLRRGQVIRPINTVMPSHPFRNETCEMDGARCFHLKAGSIVHGASLRRVT
jgi:hypothetical protein